MYEHISFLQKNVWVMQNHRLVIHSDKIWADSTTKSILKSAKIFGILKKKLSLDVRSPVAQYVELTRYSRTYRYILATYLPTLIEIQ